VSALRRVRAALARLAGLRTRVADEARMTEEMRFHLDHLTERYLQNGVPLEEARRLARIAFGGLADHQEAARDQLRVLAIDQVGRDVRVCFRRFRRAPLATLAIGATLAICIGATTGMFSIVDAVLLRRIPYAAPERLVWIASVRPDRADAPFSLPEFMQFHERAHGVDVGAFANWSAALATDGVAQRLQGMRMSGHGFEILGVPAAAGRLLRASDDSAGADRVVVLSDAFWRRRFNGDTGALGQTLVLNGDPYTVVGVLPRRFPLPLRDVDVVVALAPHQDPRRYVHGSTNFLRIFGRLPGSAAQAEAERELTALTKALRDQHPAAYASKLGVRLTPMQEYLVGGYRRALFLMLGSVALMLAIALANLANLLLIRATVRQGEVALQRALGASTWSIARALVTEGALLAGAGGLAGALLAWWGVALTVREGPLDVLRLDEARVDWTALLVALVLSLVATALFSLLPLGVALRADPQAALAASGRMRSGSPGLGRLRATAVVAEVALALVLTSGTATMVQSLARLERVDLGYRPDSVFVARLSLPPQKYAHRGDVVGFYQRLRDAIAARSDVASAGVTVVAPLSGLLWTVPFAVGGGPATPPDERSSANFRPVSPEYLSAIGAELVVGRAFTEADDSSAVNVAIVSRAFADRHLPGNPVGREILVDDNNTGPRPLTVVGVVGDLRQIALDGQRTDDIFIPLRQVHPDGLGLVTANQFWTIRLRTEPSRFDATFLRLLHDVDKDVATAGLGTLRGYVDATLAPRRFSATLLVAFAAMALVLATVGVYGVMAYSVELRRREIALRLALGETPRGAVELVLRGALRVVALGVVLGAAGALVGGRAMQGLWFGVAPGDPRVLGAVAALLAITTILASWLPARRAAHIDPIAALAGE
jgi:putative ABC transport system permease protein